MLHYGAGKKALACHWVELRSGMMKEEQEPRLNATHSPDTQHLVDQHPSVPIHVRRAHGSR